MIPFFRRIRKQLAGNNKPVQYLRYAIGEIVLVVIGILIALQINNWNTQRIENKKLQTYYQNMHEEIGVSLAMMEKDIQFVGEQQQDMKLSLHYLKSNNPDTLQKLSTALNRIVMYNRNDFAFPVIEEFLDNGMLPKVRNDSLKILLRFFSSAVTKSAEVLDRDAFDEISNKIIPYLMPRANIMDIVSNNPLYETYYSGMHIRGGPKTDFTQFSGDMEFWNLCALKLQTFNMQIIFLNYWIDYLHKVDAQLLMEMHAPKAIKDSIQSTTE